ncbi:hypothetical protein Tco_0204475 [Tanacetum coccineum]
MAKQDMDVNVPTLKQEELNSLVKKYYIPLDLHLGLPPSDLCMSKLPGDVIDRRAIPEYMTWVHPKSCVSNEFPTDGFDQADVMRLCVRCAKLHNIAGVVALVPFGPTESVIRFMSIYDLMTIPSCDDVQVLEEPHQFNNSILKRVDNHTTTSTAVGTPLLEPTSEEIVASHPDRKVVKKPKATAKRKASTKPGNVENTNDTNENINPDDDRSKSSFAKYLENRLDKVEEDGSSGPIYTIPVQSFDLRIGRGLIRLKGSRSLNNLPSATSRKEHVQDGHSGLDVVFLPYTVIIPCLTNTEAIESGPEPSFVGQLLRSTVLASNLHPGLPPSDLCMSKLLGDVIGVVALVPFGPTESVIRCKEKIMLVPRVHVLEEPHQFNNSILKRVDNHTTTSAAVGTPLFEPTLEEIVASHPDRKVVKKAKATAKRKASTKPGNVENTDDTNENINPDDDRSKSSFAKYLENRLDKAEEDGSSGPISTIPVQSFN